MDSNQLDSFRDRIEDFLGEFLYLWGRSERRRWGSAYVHRLLLNGERKSIEPMAARLPGGNVQAMQQIIGQSPWDVVPVRKKLAEFMSRKLAPASGWIIDDFCFPKRGKHSVGVSRQYSETLGKVLNCQVATSLSLATDQACMPRL